LIGIGTGSPLPWGLGGFWPAAQMVEMSRSSGSPDPLKL